MKKCTKALLDYMHTSVPRGKEKYVHSTCIVVDIRKKNSERKTGRERRERSTTLHVHVSRGTKIVLSRFTQFMVDIRVYTRTFTSDFNGALHIVVCGYMVKQHLSAVQLVGRKEGTVYP